MSPQSTAASRTLAIPEILTIILLHLPQADLLLSQRLCRLFKITIETYLPIQRALFFSSDPTIPAKPSTSNAPTSDSDDQTPKHDYKSNPLLAQHFAPWFFAAEQVTDRNLRSLPWTASPARRDAFLRPEASWRRMLTTQPAVRRLVILQFVSSKTGAKRLRAELVFNGRIADRAGPATRRSGLGVREMDHGPGLRMGVLYDLAREWVDTDTRRENADFLVRAPESGDTSTLGPLDDVVVLRRRVRNQCRDRTIAKGPPSGEASLKSRVRQIKLKWGMPIAKPMGSWGWDRGGRHAGPETWGTNS